jgi:hypothetical protein
MSENIESYIPFGYQPAAAKLHQLMPFQVRRVLLVSSLYDSFIMEEDGRLQDMLGQTYKGRDLGYVPTINQVTGGAVALDELARSRYDLAVLVQRLGDMDPFEFGHKAKEVSPGLPVVLLAYNTPELARLMERNREGKLDRIFVWQGDGRILAAVIQQVEDSRNAAHDTELLGLRNILLVEDNPKFYSSYLVDLYEALRSLTDSLLSEDLTYTQRSLRQRARPKVLLAEDYEAAESALLKYGENLLGVISDIRFPRDGRTDPEAGIRLASLVRQKHPHLPVLIQSSEPGAKAQAEKIYVNYLDKSLPSLAAGIQDFLNQQLGFGEMELCSGSQESYRLSTPGDLNFFLERLPTDLLRSCLDDGSLIRWLHARTELDLAHIFSQAAGFEASQAEEVRRRLLRSISDLRSLSHRGSLVPFTRSFFRDPALFSRIGGGSIGGKARGLAFIDRVLNEKLAPDMFPGVKVSIPKTVVLGTDVFDAFIRDNGLLDFALSQSSDVVIANRFIHADLSARVVGDLRDFIAECRTPLAVRSSSLLEDALYQPFAGIYATKMIPNNQADTDNRFLSLVNAIKFVFASVFFRRAKAYIEATGHRPQEEKMAVIIQEVVGRRRGRRFYPDFSGVGRSYNYYPVGHAKPQDGVVNLALGLGKTIVDGGVSLRFTPAYPQVLPQFGTARDMMDNAQRRFYAVDLGQSASTAFTEEDQYLAQHQLAAAEEDGVLDFLASTYDFESDCLRDGINSPGPRIVSFAHLLKNEMMPLASLCDFLLKTSERAMACPVEIEFACVLDPKNALPADFGFLQVRPLVTPEEQVQVDLEVVGRDRLLLYSHQALGNGTIRGLGDIVFVRPERFDAARTPDIAREVSDMNSRLRAEGRYYLLIGPGRWGSSDPWLGIPVDWSQITNVRAIVEVSLPNMNVDPSQGSHFFQNMTSLRIGYFTVPLDPDRGAVDWDWLGSQPVLEETEHLRLVRVNGELEVRLDGRTGRGLVLKPV